MSVLEKDLTIDFSRLDVEWINLPSLYFKYREETDYLETRMRKKKLKLEFETSQLDGKIRLDPKNYIGVEKPTETQIRCFIESDENIYSIKSEMLELEKKKKLLASACSALEMKRDALKNLVQLLNGEYFTTKAIGPSVPVAENGSCDMNIERRNIRREIKERMNSKQKENEK